MRLFVAVPLPAPALAETGRVLRSLEALGWPVRWVRPDGMHLTLKFFGEVTTDRVEPIEELVHSATRGMRPMELATMGGGAFPTRQRPRVLRLELSAPPELELLQDRLERRATEIGFAPEGRPFRPHLTLGRVREGERLPPGAIERLEAVPHGAPFHADRVVLFESTLTPAGPSYRVRVDQRLSA